MKLQHQAQTLRFRVDEAELAVLLAGGEVANRLCIPGGPSLCQTLVLAELETAAIGGTPTHWRVALPRAAVESYCGRLPCRDGLPFQAAAQQDGGSALRMVFEVDVRDSARTRTGAARGRNAEALAVAGIQIGFSGDGAV